ncbi:MAG: ABC transporter permease, partial [Streptosporangiaceae bacterium]
MGMLIARRLAFMVFVLWGITLVTFLLYRVVPGDPARLLAGPQASPVEVAHIARYYGLDDPLIVQYGHFVGNAVRGDLGYDYYHQVPVTSIIADAAPKSASLAVGAASIWLIMGVFNGVVSAVRPRSIADRGLTVFALFFYSMPTFVLGLLFLYFLYFQLTLAGYPWFPPGGYVPFTQDPAEW